MKNLGLIAAEKVSILTRLEGRVQPLRRLPKGPPNAMFQSSPDSKVGCNDHEAAGPDRARHVSILTRLEGRVQRSHSERSSMSPRFQSSPDSKVGCNSPRGWRCRPSACFNPHPTRRSGATDNRGARGTILRVSILTRLEGRVQRRFFGVGTSNRVVSILTRLEGRVQLQTWRMGYCEWEFQSSPDSKVGCNANRPGKDSGGARFQSSPDSKVGCNQSL